MKDRICRTERELCIVLAVFLIVLFALIVIFQESKYAHARLFSLVVPVMLHQKRQTNELMQFGTAADEDETEYGQCELAHRSKYKDFPKTGFPVLYDHIILTNDR